MEPPKKLYLQWLGDGELEENGAPSDVTWCVDKIYEQDVLYIRADLAGKADMDILKLQERIEDLEWQLALYAPHVARQRLKSLKEDIERGSDGK